MASFLTKSENILECALPVFAENLNEADDLILYLHGFPGAYQKQSFKQRRAVDSLYSVLKPNQAFLYPLYTQDRPFSPRQSFQKILKTLFSLNIRRPIHLMGQSFGALLALNLCREIPVSKVSLLTPFVGYEDVSIIENFVRDFAASLPVLIPEDEILKVSREILALMKVANQSIQEIEANLLLATRDEKLPIENFQKLFAEIQNPQLKIEEIDAEHSLLDAKNLETYFQSALECQ